MLKNSKMADKFRIYPTPGIVIENIEVGDTVEFTDPDSHGRHFNKVNKIITARRIEVIDVVKDKKSISLDCVRGIFKFNEEAGKYLPIPLGKV